MHPEQFADPVVVPGPNIRSRFTDTETVEEGTAGAVDDVLPRCPTCDREVPGTALTCPVDGTVLLDLPGPGAD